MPRRALSQSRAIRSAGSAATSSRPRPVREFEALVPAAQEEDEVPEGYAATAGESLVRRELCAEAIRLARVLHRLMPDEPEAAGLLGLMLLQDSRRDARTGGASSCCSRTRTARSGTGRSAASSRLPEACPTPPPAAPGAAI